MRLTLVGDIHAHRLLVPPWQLFGKRLLGQLNLWVNRRHQFNLRLLVPVLKRAAALEPSLMLFTGDLSTTALYGEFADVERVLSSVGKLAPALIVPGNHDRYTYGATRSRMIERVFPKAVPASFPHVRKLNEIWHLLALDSAMPRWLSSRGKLGHAQLDQARDHVTSMTEEQGLVVLCHYPLAAPPRVKMRWGHQLEDGAALAKLLGLSRARVLLMHGHVHQPWCWQPTDSALAHVTDVNAGSPTLCDSGSGLGHGFWQIDLPADVGGSVDLVRHEPVGQPLSPSMDAVSIGNEVVPNLGWRCHRFHIRSHKGGVDVKT